MSKSMKILIVDDLEGSRNLLGRFIKKLHYTPLFAEDGFSAFDLMREEKPAMALLDIEMPGMNGREILEKMKDDPKLRNIPVVMISAFDDVDLIADCIELGADDYLTKPYNPVLLKARISSCLDKQRLRETEMALKDRLAAVGKSVNYIVHDLKQPVNAVYHGVELINAKVEASQTEMPEGFDKIISLLKRSSKRMSTYLDEMLEFSRDPKLDLKFLPIQPVIGSAIQRIQYMHPDQNIQFEHCGAEGVSLSYDLEKLERVLINIGNNAVEAMLDEAIESPLFKILVSHCNNHVTVKLLDNGPGIPDDLENKIFEPFVTKGKSGGTGLGLAIARQIVNAHGGEIQLEPSASGACFKITLPITAA